MQVGDVAMLILLDGAERGRRWPLQAERVVIGREPEADIVIPDRRISRLHAEIERRDGKYYLRDLDSKNGTYINGEKLEGQRELRDDDEIHIALAARLSFLGPSSTMSLDLDAALKPGLRLDAAAKRVWVNGSEVRPPLSQAQFRLLQLLYESGDKVRTRDDIVRYVWPDEAEEGITEQAIDALVRRLRERLAELDQEHSYIVTMRGHGFRYEDRAG
jgi:pSer/pThr/pTyr-binding forkhead associated (FHA) protein